MSGYETPKRLYIYLRLLLVAGVLGISALAGLLLGEWSVPDFTPATPGGSPPTSASGPRGSKTEPDSYINPDAPPIFFHVGGDACGALAREEIALAAAAGLHQYMISVPAPWNGAAALADILSDIQCVVEADPEAAILLSVNLNVPEVWLNAHPDHRMALAGQGQPYACVASTVWLDYARESLGTLLSGIAAGTLSKRVLGYAVSALAEGRWRHEGFDTCPANLRGFQAWLRNRYVDDGALRGAWGDAQVTFETVAIPAKPDPANPLRVFLELPAQQPVIDFLHYASDSTADAIAALASDIRGKTSAQTLILAPYGFSFELLNNDAGHFSLGAILDSDVDAFISPVSYSDRGLGGCGGMMGPVNSAQYHGRQWFLLDDTRTGVARDPALGTVTRLKGIHPEDIYNVQRRNFSAALVHGLGLAWSDPEGNGWLHDQDQWSQFKEMIEIYSMSREEAQNALLPEDLPPTPESDLPPQENAVPEPAADDPGNLAAEDEPGYTPAPPEVDFTEPPPEYATGLMVVVDEISRFYQQCDAPINELLLHQGRDAALRAGVATQFCLLQDLLDELAPPAPVYLFLNAFHLTQRDRERLHERLARDQACALWVYAPGYIDTLPAVDNISATTGIHAAAFAGPAQTGSAFALAGRWLDEGEAFGAAMEIAPLFYIDDKDIDALASYQASGHTSVAMRSLDAGWTSVFIADPSVTPKLLREMLRILEQHVYFRETTQDFLDTVHIGRGLMAVHGKGAGDRPVVLDGYYDIQDLFDPAIGWPQKDSFVLPLKTGETRLLRLTPVPFNP
jgi:hypothetical protein